MSRRLLIIGLVLFAVIAAAQFRGNRGRPPARSELPTWEVNPRFPHDVFTFVRAEFNSGQRGGGGGFGRGWANDFPGADQNFSWRLHQMTSFEVASEPDSMPLTDPRLNDFPFIFMNDPRSIDFSEEEAQALRNYLLSGGFLLVDDFWGNQMWNHIEAQMQRVFPGRKWQSLAPDHPIYRIALPLSGPPQVPSEDSAHDMKDDPDPARRTWEYDFSNLEPQPADYRGYFDDQGRLMMLICWNTDLSDGWEEEARSPWFFENFSEKFSYPMGINILTYVMTH